MPTKSRPKKLPKPTPAPMPVSVVEFMLKSEPDMRTLHQGIRALTVVADGMDQGGFHTPAIHFLANQLEEVYEKLASPLDEAREDALAAQRAHLGDAS